ncbi:MAG: hypothetical protein AAF997_06835, partial [Myxococcota bacterium]
TVWVDIMHDINAVGLSTMDGFFNEFIVGQIPIAGDAAQRTNRTGFSGNQSSLVLEAFAPTPWGDFDFYSKINLFGSATGPTPQIQMYKIWARWAWLFVGLDYTQITNSSTIPDTLDFEGPQVIPEGRPIQFAIEIPLQRLQRQGVESGWYLSIGAEDDPADMTLPEDAFVRGRIPAFIGKFIYRRGIADVELAAVYRRLGARGGGIDSDINGWGLVFDGLVNVGTRGDNFIFGGIAGQALGALIDDTQGFGLDAAPESAGSSELKPIPAYGFWLAYQHWWLTALRSTATVGYLHLNTGFDETPNPEGIYAASIYSSLNLIWSPWHAVDIGMEWSFGWRRITQNSAVDGQTRNYNHRLQWSFAFSFQ